MTIDVNLLPLEGKDGLLDLFLEIPDPRKPRGTRHPFRAVLAVSVCAVLSGLRSFLAIADYGASLPWETLHRLGFRRRDWGAPSESTIRRVLQSTDGVQLDQKIGEWVRRQSPLQGRGVAIDGKTLCGSGDGEHRPLHLVSAVLHQEGIVLAQQPVDQKSNEITAVKPLLNELNLEGAVVTADALHTQKEFARYTVEDKHADYVLIAKDNQPTLREEIQAVPWDAFPPSGERDHGGQRPRPHRNPHDPSDG